MCLRLLQFIWWSRGAPGRREGLFRSRRRKVACSVSRCRLREPLSWFWAGTALGALRVVLLEFTCTEQSQVGFMILSLKPEKLRSSTVLKLCPGSPCSRVTVPRPELAGMRPRVGAVPIGSQPGAQGHPCPLGNSAACPEVEQSPHGKTRLCLQVRHLPLAACLFISAMGMVLPHWRAGEIQPNRAHAGTSNTAGAW